MLEDKYFPGFTQQFIETEPGVQINTWIGGHGAYGGAFNLHGHPEITFNLAVLGATLG